MNKIVFLLLVSALLLVVDYYVFQAVRVITVDKSAAVRRWVHGLYWGINLLTLLGIFVVEFSGWVSASVPLRRLLLSWVFMLYFSKLFAVLFLALDDALRLAQWAYQKFSAWWAPPAPTPAPAELELLPDTATDEADAISRSEFLMKAGLVAAAVPMATMSFGILSGAHDYRLRRVKVLLPNLPPAFDGITIGQLSDIHSGSFYNKTAVKGGVEMLLAAKPDVVLFTGDLVNDRANEMRDYQDIFGKVKAPLGVYSVLGNHDYGDYVYWDSAQAKYRNLEDLKKVHGLMGWQLLMNEHRMLRVNGEQIALIGIENWGAKGRFPKYGRLAQAHQGTQEAPVKLLLSHDPSHWDAQVRTQFPDIDVMFAGHTHGMQFGIEVGNFKWSPVQYMYEQWAGLYTQGNQHLYVNRGFGFLGYPGRIGILPEITLMELRKA